MSDLPHESPKVQAAFDLPFKEQVAFFAQKVRLPTQSYKDLTAVQHDKAFVVAGAMKADLLQDLYEAVQKAINDGESIGQFRKRFDDIVTKRGWANWTGSDSREGKAWRTQIIYSTNLRTSHAAGRWQQMTDPVMMKLRPYWQYRHITIENPRINHKRLNNLVLPADDAWWRVNYPPNGWGCHCYVITLSQYDMDRQGLSVDKTPSYDGAEIGWGHAVGSTWYPNLDKYASTIAKGIVASNMANGVFERWLGRIEDQLTDYKADTPNYDTLRKEDRITGFRKLDTLEDFDVAVLSEAQQSMLGVNTRTIKFSENDALKQAISRDGNTGFDASSYLHVQALLDNATLVIREYDKKVDKYRQQTTWVEGIHTDGKRYLAVLHQTGDNNAVYLKSYRLDKTSDEKLKKKGKVLFER